MAKLRGAGGAPLACWGRGPEWRAGVARGRGDSSSLRAAGGRRPRGSPGASPSGGGYSAAAGPGRRHQIAAGTDTTRPAAAG